jgi:hypothetical protein
LSKKEANWYAAEKIVGVLHARITDRNTRTKKELALEVWAVVRRALSFEVQDSRIGADGSIRIQFPFEFIAPERPPASAPLDRNKLNKPEHIYWIKVGLGLRELGPFLSRVVHSSAENFHRDLLAEVDSRGIAINVTLNGGLTLFKPETGTPSPLDQWADAIMAHHMGGMVTWSNSNAAMWGVPAGFFEVMKLFCASMGKHAQALKKTSAAHVDFSSLTAILQLCDHFKADNEAAEKQRKGLIRAAAGARNPWAHNQLLEFTKEESDQHLGAVCSLLENEPLLKTVPETKAIVERIQQIRDLKLTIDQVEDAELRELEQQRAVMTRMDELGKQIQGVSDQVQDLAESNVARLEAISQQQRANLLALADAEEAGARAKAKVLRSASSGEYSNDGAQGSKEEEEGKKDGNVRRQDRREPSLGSHNVASGGIVAAICNSIPRIAAGLSAEVPGAHRLQGEHDILGDAGAHILEPASAESMRVSIEQHNPTIVHIAGHNQDKGTDRLVGFSEGADGDELTELEPGTLASIVINSAALNAADAECALACIVIDACSSVRFAAALLKSATESTIFQNDLRVVCWPHLTDDIMCQRFAKGFYKFFSKRASNLKWLKFCFESGISCLATRKVKLTPELVRGGGSRYYDLRASAAFRQ